MLSPSLEDYLEEAYRLSFLKNRVRVGSIAQRLNVSAPSVVKALKKLHEEGYMIYTRYADIKLTDRGIRLGELLVRRNTMLQDFLRIIGSKCDVAAEAEAMEHYLCASTITAFERLISFLKIEEVRDMYERYSNTTNAMDWSKEIENVYKE